MSCVSRGSDGHAFMTGVFDGHAGPHCAQAVAERLFYYTYFANCSNDEIKTMLDKYHKKRPLPLFGIRYFLSISILQNDLYLGLFTNFRPHLGKNFRTREQPYL